MSDAKTRKEIKQERKAAKKERKKQQRREKYSKKWEKQRRLCVPADKKGRHKIGLISFLRVFFFPLRAFFYRYKLHGNKKVGLGAYIYVGNHYSIWDPYVSAMTTREGIHFIAKQSLLEAPFIGYFVRKAGAIGAERDGSDVRCVMEAIKVLRNGEKISIFPEGTRNKVSDEEFLPFRGGAAMLAIKTKTPIIPFVLCNRPHLFCRVHVMVGEPLEFTEFYGKRLTAEDFAAADEILVNRLYELRQQFRQERAQKHKKRNRE